MKKTLTTLAALVAAVGLTLTACGPASPNGSSSTLSGVVSANQAVSAVTVRDASSPAQQVTATVDPSGMYSADVTGLHAPYLVEAQWTDASGTHAMYSQAPQAGTANVNPVTDAAVRKGSHGGDDGSGETGPSTDFEAMMSQLGTVLKPLFDLYGVTNPATDDGAASTGLRALLHDVKFSVASGTLTVTNVQTGGVIFSGPLSNLSSGTFHPENLPTPSTPTPPAICTAFTYTSWMPATCPTNGQQTRTVLSSSPAGCTGGAPVLTQTCTPPAPAPAPTCTAFAYTSWMPATCPTSGQQTRTVLSSSPAGCTGGAPVLTQTCTPPAPPPPATCSAFTYTAWAPATCPTSGQQTRTVLTSSPAGCTGGAPVLTQTCTPPPPPPATCSAFTYTAWAPATCPTSGQQTRTVLTSSPAGCTGGAPVLTQACTPPPPAIDGAALYTQSCAGCHGALASSNLKGKNISVSLIKSMGMTQGLTDAQLQAIVTAVGP
ncbi:c-type cytochrome [Anaeromyxobacter oryzae]|uniref:Cytochrome c n=1 Tax=Anaeromyxobacter oryzae TaxID=2918170 RepID=A0ABN6MKW6_9BACT|nr:cytochrome c [Anaeromyxobacter oryzae]BDG01686.1 cytochrome c [Anaeromyxobacter oryzae]